MTPAPDDGSASAVGGPAPSEPDNEAVEAIEETLEAHQLIDPEQPPSLNTRAVFKIVLRLVFAAVAVVIAGIVLFNVFEDLNFEDIRAALATLSDAEWLALGFGWLIWIGTQGLQTASLVHHLPARRGVQAFLGPSAVAAILPGPSDLPVRYSMYQSWGVSANEAATAVAASGIFSIGSQLALPAIAGVAIFVGDIPLDGFMTIIVAATLVLAVAIVVITFVLGSEQRTLKFGHLLDPVWRFGHRILRRDPPENNDLGRVMVEQRANSLDHISDKWLPTSGATVLAIVAKCSLLVMALRFVGIPEDDLGWAAIFAVYALVVGLTIIPLTPGSAGVAEVALVGMLAPIAGSAYVNEVAAGVLLYRLLTWLLLIPTGMGTLGAWWFLQRRGRG